MEIEMEITCVKNIEFNMIDVKDDVNDFIYDVIRLDTKNLCDEEILSITQDDDQFKKIRLKILKEITKYYENNEY